MVVPHDQIFSMVAKWSKSIPSNIRIIEWTGFLKVIREY